jgi:hypothetical protein
MDRHPRSSCEAVREEGRKILDALKERTEIPADDETQMVSNAHPIERPAVFDLSTLLRMRYDSRPSHCRGGVAVGILLDADSRDS